jgi:hypothetical protein
MFRWIPSPLKTTLLHKLYYRLKADANYQKKVTWLQTGTNIPLLACVEYLGRFPGHMAHGNAQDKDDAHVYKRTSSRVLDTIKEKVITAPPRQVYRDMVLQTEDVQAAPRNSKQVRNIRHNLNRASRPGGEAPRANLPDHICR